MSSVEKFLEKFEAKLQHLLPQSFLAALAEEKMSHVCNAFMWFCVILEKIISLLRALHFLM
jgi:hypothetical protein